MLLGEMTTKKEVIMASTLKLKSGKAELSYERRFLCVQVTTENVGVTSSVIKLSKTDKLETCYSEPNNNLRFNFDDYWGFTLVVEDHKEANEVAKYLLSALTDANNPTTSL